MTCERCDRLERLSRQKTTLIARLERENERLREEVAELMSGDAMLPTALVEVANAK